MPWLYVFLPSLIIKAVSSFIFLVVTKQIVNTQNNVFEDRIWQQADITLIWV
jgi:hypothetical protein